MDILLNNANKCDEVPLEDGEISDEGVCEVVVETVEEGPREASDVNVQLNNSNEEVCDRPKVKAKKHKHHKKKSHRKRLLSSDEPHLSNPRKRLKSSDDSNDNNEFDDGVIKNKKLVSPEWQGSDHNDFRDNNETDASLIYNNLFDNKNESCGTLKKSNLTESSISNMINEKSNPVEVWEVSSDEESFKNKNNQSKSVFISNDSLHSKKHTEDISENVSKNNCEPKVLINNDQQEKQTWNYSSEDENNKPSYTDKLKEKSVSVISNHSHKDFSASHSFDHQTKIDNRKGQHSSNYKKDRYSPEHKRDRYSPEHKKDRYSPEHKKDRYSPEYKRGKYSPEYKKDKNSSYYQNDSNSTDHKKYQRKDSYSPHRGKDSYPSKSKNDSYSSSNRKDSHSSNRRSPHASNNQRDSIASDRSRDSFSSDKHNSKRAKMENSFHDKQKSQSKDSPYNRNWNSIEKDREKSSLHNDRSKSRDSNGCKRESTSNNKNETSIKVENEDKQTWNYNSDDDSSTVVPSENNAKSKPFSNIASENQSNSLSASDRHFPDKETWKNPREDSFPSNKSTNWNRESKTTEKSSWDHGSGDESSKSTTNDRKTPVDNNNKEMPIKTNDVEKASWNYDSDEEVSSKVAPTARQESFPSSNHNHSYTKDKQKDESKIKEESSWGEVNVENSSKSTKTDCKVSSETNWEMTAKTEDTEKMSWNYDSDEEGTSKVATSGRQESSNNRSVALENKRDDKSQNYDTKSSWGNKGNDESSKDTTDDWKTVTDNNWGKSTNSEKSIKTDDVEKTSWNYDSDEEGSSKVTSNNRQNSESNYNSGTSNRNSQSGSNNRFSNRTDNCGGNSDNYNDKGDSWGKARDSTSTSNNGNNKSSYGSDWRDTSTNGTQSSMKTDDVETNTWNYDSDQEVSVTSSRQESKFSNRDIEEPRSKQWGNGDNDDDSYKSRNNNRNDYNKRDYTHNTNNNNNGGKQYGGVKKFPCKYFQSGSCRQGDNCKFLHESPVNAKVNETKIEELCSFYEHQDCYKKSMCQYMHEEFPCKLFHAKAKSCPAGDKCKYSHSPLNAKMKALLEKYLGEKLDDRSDRSASGSIHGDGTDNRPRSNTPCNDDAMTDPYFQNPMQQMSGPVPWNHPMMPYGNIPMPAPMDLLQNQRFMMERFPMMPAAFFGMPHNGHPFPIAPMKDLDSLAQILVGKDSSVKKSPLKVNNQELSSGALGYPGFACADPAMMDYINMAAFQDYLHQQPRSVHSYDRPWKPFVLAVPVKTPYPLMNIDTDHLAHKFTDPRLKGHPSVLNSASTVSSDHQPSSVTVQPSLVTLDTEESPPSPVYPISEEAITFLATAQDDADNRRVLDRSYLQDPRFKRKKLTSSSAATNGPMRM